MVCKSTTLIDWPIGIFGDPVLKNTTEAYFYARLIWQSPEHKGFLIQLRSRLQRACLSLLNE